VNKRFIEFDLPLAEISKESAREKNIHHGHISTLHIWWARRPLSSSRATNFASLIDLPKNESDRRKIKNLITKISPWEAVKNCNNADIKTAQEMLSKQWNGQMPRVLDPFSGGGSIPLEALRIGCNTYSNDYNPLAVFIEKATVEWPQKYSFLIDEPNKKIGIDGKKKQINFLYYMVERWSRVIYERVKNEIGKFYPNDSNDVIPVSYLWAKTIKCQNPACGAEIPLIRQFWLAKKKNKKVAYKPVINGKTIYFKIIEKQTEDFDPNLRTVSRADARCLVCNQVTKAKDLKRIAKNGELDQNLNIVVLKNIKNSGKLYRIATKKDIEIFNEAEKRLNQIIDEWPGLENPIPNEKIAPVGTYGIDAQRYTKNEEWGELFNSRQKLALLTFLIKIKNSYEEIKDECSKLIPDEISYSRDDAAKAIIGYLGLGLGRMVDRNSNLCIWNNVAEKTEHVFGRQALPSTWDYSEANVFGNQGWTLQFSYILSPLKLLTETKWKSYAKVTNYSATDLKFEDDYFDAIFTDPPYYDNVPYSDLSDFFYVWLKRCIGDYFPDIFSTPQTPKTLEAIAEPMRQEKPYEYFESMLSRSFREMYRILKPNGIVTIVYAHKTTEGWETLLNSLVNAGFVVTASWPIHTERSGRLRGQSSAALASSIYMVCRKHNRDKVGFYNELKNEIKNKVEEKLLQFWNEGIAGGDFFISAIGPGMEIFSKYEKVEKLSGKQVTTSELLDYIREISTDFIVNKLLKDSSSSKIDNQSEFYLAYRWTFLDNTVDYDDARKLASASGIALEKLWSAGGIIKKNGSKISVLGPKERDYIDKTNTMVDVMHKSVLLWERGERDKLSKLLTETGYGKDPAFKQFCQAIAESLINGNKEKQLLEGFLIGIDAYTRGKAKAPKDQTDLKQFGGS
jgi:putative DNA methylase